jgi:hypothetical protein
VPMGEPKRKGVCAYCGKIGPLTRDHIPPRCLFGKQPPANLLTVPSCLDCNHTASEDDEYLQMVFSMHGGLSENPHVEKIRPTFHRSLANPRKQGFTLSMLAALRNAYLRTPSGTYVGSVAMLVIDDHRLEAVVRRIALGLIYRECKARLPDGYEVNVYQVGGLRAIPLDIRRVNEMLLPQLLASGLRDIGGGVFAYAHKHEIADRYTSAWLLLFYQTVAFFALTVPNTAP